MATAFTAVADDATAFFWNPAGFARGDFLRLGFLGGDAFHDRGQLVNRLRDGRDGRDASLEGYPAAGFSAGFTFMGVSVNRLTYSRTILDGGRLRSKALETWDVAVSILQSLPPEDLTLGVNLRYVQGTAYGRVEDGSEVDPSERNAIA